MSGHPGRIVRALGLRHDRIGEAPPFARRAGLVAGHEALQSARGGVGPDQQAAHRRAEADERPILACGREGIEGIGHQARRFPGQ